MPMALEIDFSVLGTINSNGLFKTATKIE